MLLHTISIVYLSSSLCHGWYEAVTSYDDATETSITDYRETWTRYKSGYWLTGLAGWYRSSENDRTFQWRFARPTPDSNCDYSYSEQPSTELSITSGEEFVRNCANNYAISKIWSNREDVWRQFKITCKKLPSQYTFDGCVWTGYLDHTVHFDYTCDGLVRGIDSYRRGTYGRYYKFRCCNIKNTPMSISATYDETRVLTSFRSDYQSDDGRYTSSLKWGKPNWYQDGANIVANSNIDLTTTNANAYFWVRLFPLNGAFTTITQNTNNSFDIMGAKFIGSVKTDDCVWTDYLNEFHSDFTGSCDRDGVIRGIQSYYSAASDDRKFKIYCCDIIRATYTANTDIKIKLKSTTHTDAKSNARITLDLCWNNYLYQGFKILSKMDTWRITDDVVRYDTCGNDRALTLSFMDNDNANIEAIAVEDNGVDYIIETFNVHTSGSAAPTIENDFWLDEEHEAVVITFPDDYLTQCADSTGCTGDLYNLYDFQQYLITITQCASYSRGSGTPKIGVILRGLNGNLDNTILTGPTFQEVPAGKGNIGDLIHVNLEYESGPDVCIESITLNDPYDGTVEFGKDYFGDGIILSNSCVGGGDFRLLTGIQYVPCYDTPFSITTYETSLYTSVQIHACDTSDGGITKEDSGLLTLTITGISKNDKFVSSDMLSLESSTDWSGGNSRDFTLQLSGDFDRISLITLGNNHPTADFCVDSVLINGEDAFLSHYWVGFTADHDCLPTIPAVLEWPICDVELTTTISAESPLPVDPEAVATSTCVNRNRLVSVDCSISQSFETYQEVSWAQETGQEVTNDITMESGTSTSVSAEISMGFERSVGVSGGGVEATDTLSASMTAGFNHEWSSSMAVSNGVTQLDVTTDGKVNGKTIGIDCSGSVSVPPSQQIQYSLLIDHSEAKLTTLTDIKMTKCSAYLYGEDRHDPNDYIYIYGIVGELTVKEATNCYVSFSQAEQVSPKAITCGEERALATREWGTYVPQCDENDPDKYSKCQCAFGDSLTLPTCGCVDETSGNLMDTAAASVVAETDTYKWTHWCEEYCVSESVNISSAYAQSLRFEPDIDTVNDNKVSDKDKKGIFFENNVNVLLGIFVLLAFGIITYMINSCISCFKSSQCGSTANTYYYHTEIEKEIDL